jgi:hypothetical protein
VLTLVTRSKRTANSTASSTRAVSSNYLDLRVAGIFPANRWLDVEIVSANGGEIFAEPLPRSASAFEDHLGQSRVGAVRDAEGNGCDAEAPGEFVRASV